MNPSTCTSVANVTTSAMSGKKREPRKLDPESSTGINTTLPEHRGGPAYSCSFVSIRGFYLPSSILTELVKPISSGQSRPLMQKGNWISKPGVRNFLFATIAFISALQTAFAAEPPTAPVGYDAYRMWDKWPQQRIGVRAYMRSTYDRRGGNEAADASHFLCQQADDFNVTLDVEGPGILYFARYNHWHGSPWHYVVDGRDHLIEETSTTDPLNPVNGSTFLPASLFPAPLAWTWAATRGADLMGVPIPFEKSFRMD